jgi:hypothetical protein
MVNHAKSMVSASPGVKGFAGGFNERAFPVRYLGTPGQYLSKIFYKL